MKTPENQLNMFEKKPEPKKQEPKHDDSVPVIIPNDNAEQVLLLETGEWWENHWKQMPEYKSQDLMPFKTIYVHFENRKNMDEFAKLLGQTITLDTQSIWYPELEIQDLLKKKYVDTK